MIRNFIFWFCVPWALFFGLAGAMYLFRHPEKLLWLLPIIVLLGFATWAEYRKMMARAKTPTPEAAAQSQPHFNRRGPGQFTSFAFRYGLPPGVLQRQPQHQQPPLPLAQPPALPPPADEG